jgi:hypothetical protein
VKPNQGKAAAQVHIAVFVAVTEVVKSKQRLEGAESNVSYRGECVCGLVRVRVKLRFGGGKLVMGMAFKDVVHDAVVTQAAEV